jgi:hypothetical protein
MRISIAAFALTLFGISSLYAQESFVPTLGFKVGVPVTEPFSTSSLSSIPSGNNSTSTDGTGFSYHIPRYEFGVSAEFHLPAHLRFEVDGLFKRGGFNSTLPFGTAGGFAYSPTTFNQWEIPGLFKYNVSLGHFRPFIDFGASYRHISTITQKTSVTGGDFPIYTDNSFALHNRNSFGGVAGIGFTFKKGPFELTPEARYTRWANSAFQTNGFRSNLDQGDVLLGIGF